MVIYGVCFELFIENVDKVIGVEKWLYYDDNFMSVRKNR